MRLTLGVHGMPMQYPGDPSAYSQWHSINCACDAKRSIVPHEPCAPKCWKTKNQKTKKTDPTGQTKNQKPKFWFWFLVFQKIKNQKNKKIRPNKENQKPKFGFWFLFFQKTKTPKKTHAPFGFGLACWVCFFCFFWFLVFQKTKTQNPNFGFWFLVLGLIFLVFGFWFGPWGLYLFVSWLLVFCRGGGHIYKFIFLQKGTAKTFSGTPSAIQKDTAKTVSGTPSACSALSV